MPATSSNLLVLQGNVKRDPGGYVEEFEAQLRRYRASLEILRIAPAQQHKDFGSLVTFVAQVSCCYPQQLDSLSSDLMQLLDLQYSALEQSLRLVVLKAIILLRNRRQLSAELAYPFFIRMLHCQDKGLRVLAFRHMLSDIKAANRKHCNDQLNRMTQNLLYSAVADANELAARKSLAILVELWRRHVWRDSRTVSVIVTALLHPSMRVALPALKFFLGQDEHTEADDSQDDGEGPAGTETVAAPSREDVYKATSKGTAASKKKKKAKLQRVMATVKRAAQKGKADQHQSFAALQLLRDPQDLAEKLLARVLHMSGERWEAKLALLQVMSRIVGVHRLLLLNFYPLLQKYLQPHQRDVPALLAVVVQACHDLVPPETLQPILRQLVDGFVHDRAQPPVMTLGLRTVRELCVRQPLVMTSDLLQDLALYRKFREKEVASAARSLISLFREIAPGMLEKRDRGRGADAGLTLPAYGMERIAERVTGADLLQAQLSARRQGSLNAGSGASSSEISKADRAGLADSSSEAGTDDDGAETQNTAALVAEAEDGSDGGLSDVEVAYGSCGSEHAPSSEVELQGSEDDLHSGHAAMQTDCISGQALKRKRQHQPHQPDSLLALRKRIAASHAKRHKSLPEAGDHASQSQMGATIPVQQSQPLLEQERFLTAEDFETIRELRQEKLVEAAMTKHGLKSAAKRAKLMAAAQDDAEATLEAMDNRRMEGEQRLNPGSLQGKHKQRKDKAERLASVLQGREGNTYGAAAGRKKQKAGGLSNKEKQKRKHLPAAARSNKSAQRVAAKGHKAAKTFRGRVKRPRHK